MSDGPAGAIFEVSEESVVNGVDFVFTRFLKWNDPVTSESTDGTRVAVPREGAVIQAISEQTIDLLEEAELTIQGVRAATSAYGDRTLTYKVPGMLMASADDGATLVALDLPQYVQDAGDVIVDRRGYAAINGSIKVSGEITGEPGDYLDLEVPHQVNAKVGQTPVAQRGGTRKVQIVGADPFTTAPRTLQFEDAGNLAQTIEETPDPPESDDLPVPEFDLEASADSPLTIATATVTNDADLLAFGADVEWEYAVSDTEPTDPGTPFGPLLLGFGVTTIDTPAVPSGSTLWARARAAISATGERSDFSAWQSVTLGPASNGGTPGTAVPTLTLAAQINSSTGQLDASAETNGTSVKFAVGAAGGASPSLATVRAATADSSAPFAASALATMALGEVRTVAAFAYDALGNESLLATQTVTRSSSAPSDADYLVKTANANLSAERVVTDTATVAWDWATAGQAKANVPDNAVTFAKIQQIATARLLGRSTASTGNVEEISIGTGLSLSGGVLSATGGGGGSAPEWVTGNPQNFTADADPANDNFGTGSSIDTAGSRFSGATPWTARLVTTLTNDVANGALHLALPQTTATVWQGYTQPMPASGNCRYRTTFTVGGKSVNFHSVGVFVERGTGASRRTIVCAVGYNSFAGNEDKRIERFSTDSDTFSASIYSDITPDILFLRAPWWVDVEMSGTNILFYFATHRGRDFALAVTEAQATFLGGRPDRIGIGLLNADNTNGSMEAWFEGFWRIA